MQSSVDMAAQDQRSIGLRLYETLQLPLRVCDFFVLTVNNRRVTGVRRVMPQLVAGRPLDSLIRFDRHTLGTDPHNTDEFA